MPKLTVDGVGEFDVAAGKRLVLALTEDAGIDQLHACGGHARCTTCRVEFISGEPKQMTVAERDVLKARGVTGFVSAAKSRAITIWPSAQSAVSRAVAARTPDRPLPRKLNQRPNGRMPNDTIRITKNFSCAMVLPSLFFVHAPRNSTAHLECARTRCRL